MPPSSNAGTTGDAAWLAARMPTLRSMMGFLDARFDESVGLYNAPGSLQVRWMGDGGTEGRGLFSSLRSPLPSSFSLRRPSSGLPPPSPLQIDVFIRQNFTGDSNAMGVILCELFADAEAAQASSSTRWGWRRGRGPSKPFPRPIVDRRAMRRARPFTSRAPLPSGRP